MDPKEQKAILDQIEALNRKLQEAGIQDTLGGQQQGNRMSYITKPPRMGKGDSFANYCERFKAYVQMTDLRDNLDLLFMQNVDSNTYTSLKATAAALTPDQKTDADVMCRQFLGALYGDEKVSLRNDLLNMKQKPGESVAEFGNRIQEASSMAYTSPEQAREASLLALLRGISKNSLRQKMNEATVTSFPEAIRLAKKLESVTAMFEAAPILKTTEEKAGPSNEESSVYYTASYRGRSSTPYHKRQASRSRGRDNRGEYRNRSNSRNRNRSTSWNRNRSHSRGRDRSRDRYRSRNRRNYSRDSSNSRSRDRSSKNYSRNFKSNSYQKIRNIECWNCHQTGHYRSNCPRLN